MNRLDSWLCVQFRRAWKQTAAMTWTELLRLCWGLVLFAVFVHTVFFFLDAFFWPNTRFDMNPFSFWR